MQFIGYLFQNRNIQTIVTAYTFFCSPATHQRVKMTAFLLSADEGATLTRYWPGSTVH